MRYYDVGKFYVYLWTNTENGKQYVGKGTGVRAKRHATPGSSSLVGKAIKKYGRDKLELSFLAEGLEEAAAYEVEKQAVQDLKTQAPFGYNLAAGGRGPCAGVTRSAETRAKMSRAQRIAAPHRKRTKKTYTPEQRADMGRRLKAAWTPEHGQKVSAKNKGRRLPEELKAKKRDYRHTADAKTRIAAALKQRHADKLSERVSEAGLKNAVFLARFGARRKDIASWIGLSASAVCRHIRKAGIA